MTEVIEVGEKKSRNFVQEVIEHLKQLASETDDFRRSEFFKQYLETISKFWRYSYHNQLLITHQMPEASRVAGFRKWRQMGRWVRKGSKAVKILAPRFEKIMELNEETGELQEKETVVNFFPVSVFDVSQTEGEPLPEVSITVEGDNYKDFLDSLQFLSSPGRMKSFDRGVSEIKQQLKTKNLLTEIENIHETLQSVQPQLDYIYQAEVTLPVDVPWQKGRVRLG